MTWNKIGPTLSEIVTPTYCYRVGLVGKDFGDLGWCATRKNLSSSERAACKLFENEELAKNYCEKDMQLTNATF